MSVRPASFGCLGFIVGILLLIFIGRLLFTETPDGPGRQGSGDEDGSSMGSRLQQLQATRRQVVQVRLEGIPQPFDGRWQVEDVGSDVVVLSGAAGAWTVRLDAIVSVLEAPVSALPAARTAPAPAAEPHLEK